MGLNGIRDNVKGKVCMFSFECVHTFQGESKSKAANIFFLFSRQPHVKKVHLLIGDFTVNSWELP